jgi:hypothetical protein
MWRTSPEEDAIEYKVKIRSRRPKDTRPALPESYWRKPKHACTYPILSGTCGAEIISPSGTDCYYHAKMRAGLLSPLRGSMWSSSERHDRTPPRQKARS